MQHTVSPDRPARRSKQKIQSPRLADPPRRTLLWAGAAVLLSVLVYAPTLRYGFVYDDVPQILQNPAVQAHSFQPEFFTGHVWQHLFPDWKGIYYRPLFLLWLQGNYLLFGTAAVWWHAECIAIHALATLLVFLLAQHLGADHRQAFVAAAIFAVLPVHAEVVSWISGADESLACVLLLSAFLGWLRSRTDSRHSLYWYMAAVSAFLAAALMKENAIVLPAIVFVYEWRLGGGARTAFRRCLPFVAAAAAYLVARLHALGGMANVDQGGSAVAALLTLPLLGWFYFVRLVLPFGTSLFYEVQRITTPTFHGFLIPLLQCVAILGIAIVAGRASRKASFLLAGIAFLLLPMVAAISVFPDHELVHDRYVYIPSTLFAILVAAGLQRAARLLPRWITLAVATAALALLSLGTLNAAFPWRDTLELFRHASQAAPRNPRARLFFADELVKRGSPAAALPLYQEVLSAEPDSMNAMVGMAGAHFDLGEFGEAERIYKDAERATPPGHPSSTVHYFLGITENRMGKYAEAEQHLHQAISIHPGFSRYHYELAVALKGQGKLAEAREALRQELSIYPASPGAKELLREMGD